MASFIAHLWESVFTPGPNSSLLLATNASFAGLQITLLALLIATASVHFLVLSVLSFGLWAAINWFANEIKIVQALEEQKKRQEPPKADVGPESVAIVSSSDVGGQTGNDLGSLSKTSNRMGSDTTRNTAIKVSKTDTETEPSTEDEWEKLSENEKEK